MISSAKWGELPITSSANYAGLMLPSLGHDGLLSKHELCLMCSVVHGYQVADCPSLAP